MLGIIHAFRTGLLHYMAALKACSVSSFSPFCSFLTLLFHSFLQAWAVVVQRDGRQVLLFVSLIHSIPNGFFSLSVCFYLFIKLQHVRGNCFTLYIFCFWLVRGFPFTAWSRSEYSHACYTYCQQFFFSCFYLPGPFNLIFS